MTGKAETKPKKYTRAQRGMIQPAQKARVDRMLNNQKIIAELLKNAPVAREMVSEDQIEQWAAIDMTLYDMSRMTGIRVEEILPMYSDAILRGRTRGNMSLKFRAFEKAMSGDTPMLIFLLKNRAGYVDKLPEQHVNTVFNLNINEIPK